MTNVKTRESYDAVIIGVGLAEGEDLVSSEMAISAKRGWLPGGALRSGPCTGVEAIADGRRTASAMHTDLQQSATDDKPAPSK